MESIQDIPIDLIEPNPNQPRKHFDSESLQELAESIKSKGLLEPIMIRPFGEKYQIVCGERRWRACKIASLAKYIFRLWKWNVQDVNLTTDQRMWHMDYWTYHSRVEKGLCWVDDCENQPVRKVRHHWYDIIEKDSTAGMTTKAIYRSIITMCEGHCKKVSRDTIEKLCENEVKEEFSNDVEDSDD